MTMVKMYIIGFVSQQQMFGSTNDLLLIKDLDL